MEALFMDFGMAKAEADEIAASGGSYSVIGQGCDSVDGIIENEFPAFPASRSMGNFQSSDHSLGIMENNFHGLNLGSMGNNFHESHNLGAMENDFHGGNSFHGAMQNNLQGHNLAAIDNNFHGSCGSHNLAAIDNNFHGSCGSHNLGSMENSFHNLAATENIFHGSCGSDNLGSIGNSHGLGQVHGNVGSGTIVNGNFGVTGLQSLEGVYLEPAPMQPSDEADPLKDPVFNYISDMLMDEDTDDKTCMFIDCSGYQAMANELTQIISDSSSSGASESERSAAGNKANSWVDGLLNHEEVDSGLKVEAWTVSDEEYEKTANKMMSEMEISSGLTSKAAKAGGKVAEEKIQRDTLSLQSLIRECSSFLEEEAEKDVTQDHDPWAGDLTEPHDQLVAGHVRTTAALDDAAIEGEKANREETRAQLLECVQAVVADNMTKAYEIVNRIRDKVSPHGNGTQRMAFYFAEALVARITGTGTLLYSALASNRPSAHEMLKAYRLFTMYSPNVRISHYVCNQTILDATAGASRVHVIDYGVFYGLMWPCLIKAFSAREGGPPHLRITGIDFPQPGYKPSERIEETGRRLSEYAKQVGVPFEFHAVATTKWESVQPSSLFLRHDETLIVSSQFRLRHLLDESVMADSPRKLVLARIRSMKPKVFIHALVNANYNAPFFISRFREALEFYSTFFDALDTAISPEHPERLFIEQGIIGREILNVIACEGQERVERAETYKQWQSRTSKAGFEQLPLRPEIYTKARAMLRTYHKNFGIGQDGNWLLFGWKETVLHAVCAWQPR